MRCALIAAVAAAALTLPAAAGAQVTFRVSHSPAVLSAPGPVTYRLDIQGDGLPHAFSVRGGGSPVASGAFVTNSDVMGESSVAVCAGEWSNPRVDAGTGFTDEVDLPPGGETFIAVSQYAPPAPLPFDPVGDEFSVQDDGAGAVSQTISDPGPRLGYPLGVWFTWTAPAPGASPVIEAPLRAPLVIAGTAQPLPRGEPIVLKWRAPGGGLGTMSGHVGPGARFAFRLRLRRPGRYDFTVLHRPHGRFGYDAPACDLLVRAAIAPRARGRGRTPRRSSRR